MGLFDSVKSVLFGDKPDVSYRPTERHPVLTEGQQKLLDQLISGLSSQTEPSAFQTASLANLEEHTNRILDHGVRSAEEAQNFSRTILQNVLASMQDASSDAQRSEYFDRTVQKPATEAFETEVLPRIARKHGGLSFYDSDRVREDTTLQNRFIDSLNTERTRFAHEARQTDQRHTAALAQQGTAGANVLGKLGLDAAFAPYQAVDATTNARFNESNQRVNQILGALGVRPFENIAFQPVVKPGTQGLVQTVLGGLSRGIGAKL